MSQVSNAGAPIGTVHLRVPWDATRRDPQYALTVVREAAKTRGASVDVAFGPNELHIYGIDAATLCQGLRVVIASGEHRQAEVADRAKFTADGSIQLPPEHWARWNEAEFTIDYAATIRAALTRRN